MGVFVRARPITGSANLHRLVRLPVPAMLARPRFCAVTGTAKQHEFARLRLSATIASKLIRNSVIDLKISRFVFGQADSAARTVMLDQRIFELLGPNPPAGEFPGGDFCGITKSVRGYLPAVRTRYPIGLQRYTLLAHVAGSTRGMVISVDRSQFLSGNVAMFQNMLDHGPWSLGNHSLQALDELLGELRFPFAPSFGHCANPYQSASCRSALRFACLSAAAKAGDKYNDS